MLVDRFFGIKITVHDIPSDNILVLPANLVAETADSAVLAAGLQAEHTQSLGNDHLLLLVVRGRDTLEDLEALKGGGTTGSLVGDHATDSLVEDAGRSAEVEGTTTGRVVSGHLAEVGVVLHCAVVSVCSGSSVSIALRCIDSAKPPRGHSRGDCERTLRAEELARDVEGLAADDNDLLTAEELLSDDAGQAAEQVALAIDNDLLNNFVSLEFGFHGI